MHTKIYIARILSIIQLEVEVPLNEYRSHEFNFIRFGKTNATKTF